MKKAFIEKVRAEKIVDTRKFRYVSDCADYCDPDDGCFHTEFRIKRLPVEDLDTTAAIDGWETVYTEVIR